MNIFVLDTDPKQAAAYHNDKHVVKMILESVQMLHVPYYMTNNSFVGFPRTQPYRLTHKNHPCSKWVCESIENWNWLHQLAIELCNEYTHRYGKVHACTDIIKWMGDNPPDIASNELTQFALAMPSEYHRINPVESYRLYYIHEKQHLAKWTKREKPTWYT